MRFSLELVVAALAIPGVTAFPHEEARGYYVDTCKKAVFDGPARPPPHVARKEAAKADCSSYLRKTVSPCPVTKTTTKTTVKTAKPATKTTTKAITKSSISTKVVPTTIDTTLVSTAEETQLETTEVPSTTTTSITETETITSTIVERQSLTSTFSTDFVTLTETITAPLAKRSAPTDLPPITRSPAELAKAIEARNYPVQCKPKTSSAKDIPGYASACRAKNGYCSACHDLGVWEKTTTLRAPTVWKTVTQTKVVTPTITKTAVTTVQKVSTALVTKPTTKIESSVVTNVRTETRTITSVVVITTTATEVQSATVTDVTTIVVSEVATSTQTETSTIIPAPPTCTGFKVSVTGNAPGQYLAVKTDSSGTTVGFTNDATAATRFAIDAQGHLYGSTTGLFVNIDNRDLFTVYLNPESQIQPFGYVFFTCSTAVGNLQCTAGANDNFYFCPGAGVTDLISATAAGASRYGCAAPLSLSKVECA